MSALVFAIRNHPKVGIGSCASMDECWADSEILDELNRLGITTEAGAVNWALETEGIFLEKGLNQRWGADDDSQLLSYNEWNDDLI